MPFTFKIIGEISNKKILDLGCGEGGYTKELSNNTLKLSASIAMLFLSNTQVK